MKHNNRAVPAHSPDSAYEQWKRLKAEVIHHAHLYHTLDSPQISDAEYDQLVEALQQLERENPEWALQEGSPTQSVGGDLSEKFPRAAHRAPMLSLDNCYRYEEALKNLQRFQETLKTSNPALVVEYKVDGLAIHLTYRKHRLAQALTRGDGSQGEVVTEVFKGIPVPRQLSQEAPEHLEVRGEVFMPESRFLDFNRERLRKGLPAFAHPRNAAAGSIRQLDRSQLASRGLRFAAYQLLLPSGPPLNHDESLRALELWGFEVKPWRCLSSIDELEAYHQETEKTREKLDFRIDGLVIKLNAWRDQAALGATQRAPRWAFAYKFEPQEVMTQLQRVDFQVGRSGIITPRACLKPVEVAGARVSHATLHNSDELKRLELREGDWVMVRRAGEVIPQVTRCLPELRVGEAKLAIQFPRLCPCCQHPLIQPEQGVGIFCSQKSACPAAKQASLNHAVSREALNIEGLGPRKIEHLLRRFPELNLNQLVHLTEQDFMQLPGVQKTTAQKLAQAVRSARFCPLSRLIFALGIPGIGQGNARCLAEYWGDWERFRCSTFEELKAIPSIGEKLAFEIVDFFKKAPAWLEQLNDPKSGFQPRLFTLQEGSRRVGPRWEGEPSSPLSGLGVVITGSFDFANRAQLEARLQLEGAAPASQVSRSTSLLWVGNKPSRSKCLRAEAQGCEQWGQEKVELWWKKASSLALAGQETSD